MRYRASSGTKMWYRAPSETQIYGIEPLVRPRYMYGVRPLATSGLKEPQILAMHEHSPTLD